MACFMLDACTNTVWIRLPEWHLYYSLIVTDFHFSPHFLSSLKTMGVTVCAFPSPPVQPRVLLCITDSCTETCSIPWKPPHWAHHGGDTICWELQLFNSILSAAALAQVPHQNHPNASTCEDSGNVVTLMCICNSEMLLKNNPRLKRFQGHVNGTWTCCERLM